MSLKLIGFLLVNFCRPSDSCSDIYFQYISLLSFNALLIKYKRISCRRLQCQTVSCNQSYFHKYPLLVGLYVSVNNDIFYFR